MFPIVLIRVHLWPHFLPAPPMAPPPLHHPRGTPAATQREDARVVILIGIGNKGEYRHFNCIAGGVAMVRSLIDGSRTPLKRFTRWRVPPYRL